MASSNTELVWISVCDDSSIIVDGFRISPILVQQSPYLRSLPISQATPIDLNRRAFDLWIGLRKPTTPWIGWQRARSLEAFEEAYSVLQVRFCLQFNTGM